MSALILTPQTNPTETIITNVASFRSCSCASLGGNARDNATGYAEL